MSASRPTVCFLFFSLAFSSTKQPTPLSLFQLSLIFAYKTKICTVYQSRCQNTALKGLHCPASTLFDCPCRGVFGVWNSLPVYVTSIDSLPVYRRRLKFVVSPFVCGRCSVTIFTIVVLVQKLFPLHLITLIS
jgi:hypothetical protein